MEVQAIVAAETPAGAPHHRLGDVDTVDLARRGGEDHRQQPAAAEADLQHIFMRLEVELLQGQPVHPPADAVEPGTHPPAPGPAARASELPGQEAMDEGQRYAFTVEA